MPPVSGPKKLAQAVYTSIHEGTFSADQDVASAELQSDTLRNLSVILESARADVKKSVSELSRLSAGDVDGWIVQAKQLHDDITRSEKQAKEIVAFAEDSQESRESAQDARSKVGLLRGEITFNEDLVGVLEEVQQLKKDVNAIQLVFTEGNLVEASRLLKHTKKQIQKLGKRSGTRIEKVLNQRISDLRASIEQTTKAKWTQLVEFGSEPQRLAISKQLKVADGFVDIEEIATVFAELDILEEYSSDLCTSINDNLLKNLLQKSRTKRFRVTRDEQNVIKIVPTSDAYSAKTVFEDINLLRLFCQQQLPQSICLQLMPRLDAAIVDRLMETTLPASVPLDLSELSTFQETIGIIRSFAASLNGTGQQSGRKLVEWADDAPEIWLSKRIENSLDSVRKLLKRGLGRPRQVERVETQIIKSDDEVFSGNGQSNDWNEDWSDEESQPAEQAQPHQGSSSSQENGTEVNEDEEVSGWGFDDEQEPEADPIDAETKEKQGIDTEPTNGDMQEDEAWGWGEGDIAAEPDSPQLAHTTHSQVQPDTEGTPSQEREITLRESYHISAIPEQIIDVTVMVIEDADAVSRSGSTSLVFPVVKGLYLLPGLLLSMFKASGPTFYDSQSSGSMFLYNDCLYLSEQLRSYIKHHQTQNPHSTSLATISQNDLPELESFGKRAYGKEMESKRTTITDLLDGAQGFSNCTQEPFASQCDLAISSVIDFLRQVYQDWSVVLSRSALLQSIGSLLTTITNKIIIDIEDMGDISEPESQRLVSFCKSITTLEDLFLPDQQADDGQEVPLTAAYTKTWLRFQYLSNILESSLADIKYLWLEGELSMEFTMDEVTDLVEALFADSDHRRKAIAEIRRSR